VNAIEDRLRDAYRAAADTVGPDSIPALTDVRAPGRGRTGSRGIPASPGGQRWRKLAIPVAAAVAVSAIAATAWLARPDGGPSGGLGPAPGGGAAPPFIVGPPGQHGLAVYSATTGKALAHIPDPGRGLDFLKTAATANDRAFVVSAARTKGGCYTLFYRLLLTREGRLASMTRLAVPRARNQIAYGVAASADGRTIAYTAGPCDGGHGRVSVLHVGSQAVRTWSLTSEGATSPALSPDGRMLYFASSTVLAGDGTVRALRTDAPPGPVSRRARVLLPASAWDSESGSITLARQGRALLVCSLHQETATLAAYSPASGTRLSVIRSWQADPTAGACMVTATPAGNRALISGTEPGLGTRADLTTGRFRRIPAQAGTPPAGISGGLSW
jgi:hypothetical protein